MKALAILVADDAEAIQWPVRLGLTQGGHRVIGVGGGAEGGRFLTLCHISSFAIGPGVCVWLALAELMPDLERG